MTRTGSVVTLEVAKQGAIYHGLATLLNQPSPMMQRGKDTNIIDFNNSFVCLLSACIRMQKIQINLQNLTKYYYNSKSEKK